MSDKIKLIIESLKNDPELGKKLEAEFERIRASGECLDPMEFEIRAVKNVFGVELSESDLARGKAELAEVDSDAMGLVTGRGGGANSICYNASICIGGHSGPPDKHEYCYAVFESKPTKE